MSYSSVFVCCCHSVNQLCLTLCDPMKTAHQPSLFLTISQKVCPGSCPLHQWCHPAISSSDTLFSMFVYRTTKSCKPVGEDFTRALSRIPWLTYCGFICSVPTSVGFGFCTLIVRVLSGYNSQCSPYPISDGYGRLKAQLPPRGSDKPRVWIEYFASKSRVLFSAFSLWMQDTLVHSCLVGFESVSHLLKNLLILILYM